MRPTVVQVVLTEQFAGVERHVGDLSGALRQIGWRVVVAVGSRAAQPAVRHYKHSGAEVVPVGNAVIPGAAGLRRLVRSTGADVVHAHLGNAMFAALLGSAGRPVVVTHHFVRPRHADSRMGWIKTPIYRTAIRRCAATIAISDAVRAALPQSVAHSDRHTFTIPHGIPDLDTRRIQKTTEQFPVLLYVGRMASEKAPLLAIDAACAAGGNWQLWMAGTGPMESQVRARGEQLLGQRFRFLGFTENVDRLYARAQALVMPSVEEGFGLVAVEAMRSGLPVICTRAGALPEVIDDSVGRLATVNDVTALADGIAQLMNDAGLAARLGRAGRERYLASFRVERMGERTAEVYRDVLR